MSTEVRKCYTCKIDKDLSLYYKNSKKKDGIDTICIDCRREYSDKYRAKLKKVRPWETWKEGHRVCLNCENELPFSEFHKAKNGLFGLKGRCISCEQKRNTEYRQRTKWDATYKQSRRSQDPQFKLRESLRGRLLDALKRHTSGGKVNKKHSALILLECSLDFFMSHISSKFYGDMTWENYGSYWEIDHIIPCDSFDLTDVEQQRQCFHYTNLQPLTVHDNRSKGNRVTYDKKIIT